LSDADLLRFQRAIEQRLASGSGIAGFFRTHTRKGINLDPDDLAVMDARFREPHQLALLVRPFATKASTGAIFIREGGKISGDASYLEFPFRSPEGSAKAPAESESKSAPAVPAGPAPQAPPPAAKPAVRAQIVPIAPRREVSVAGVVIEDKVQESPAAVPAVSAPAVAPPAPATAPVDLKQDKGKTDKFAAKADPKASPKGDAKAAPAVEPKVETKPAPKGEPAFAAKAEAKTEAKSESKVEAKAEAKAELKVESKPSSREIEVPAKPAAAAVATQPAVELDAPAKSSKPLKLVLAALFATVLFVILFVYPGVLRQSSKAPTTAQVDGSPLQLRVERTNGDLLLTWNKDSNAIRSATKSMLTINDGEQHENIEMDLAQLRIGSIMYSPQTADISFKMEVTGNDASKTTSESVRVLRTRPSALDSSAAAAGAGKPGQPAPAAPVTTPAAATPAATTTGTQAPEPAAQPESKPVTPTRSFNAQSLSARLRPAQPTDMPDAPVVRSGGVASAIPGVNLNSVGATPNAPVPPPVAPAPTPAASTAVAKSGGQIQQAILISKKDPEYPKLARQTGARGAVKLTATVGKDGRVKSVRVISGHPMLQTAAIDAVKQWIYKPTLLNGQAVETETEIVLNFIGDR